MNAEPEDERQQDSLRLDLPFVQFRIAAGNLGDLRSPEDDAYEQARRKVRARLGFYRHLATFAAVVGVVLFIDLITGGGISEPVRWLIAIWGAILGLQLLNTFVFPAVWSRETEQRMIDDELKRHRLR